MESEELSTEIPKPIEMRLSEPSRRGIADAAVNMAQQIAAATLAEGVEYAGVTGAAVVRTGKQLKFKPVVSPLHTTHEPKQVADLVIPLHAVENQNGIPLVIFHSHTGLGATGTSPEDIEYWTGFNSGNFWVMDHAAKQPYAVHGLALPINGIVVPEIYGPSLHLIAQTGPEPDFEKFKGAFFGDVRLISQLKGNMTEIVKDIRYGRFLLSDPDDLSDARAFITRHLPKSLSLVPLPKMFFKR
ncbi:MAG: hypothetical protein AAB874_04195 [Patescibacteria group bacterium]